MDCRSTLVVSAALVTAAWSAEAAAAPVFIPMNDAADLESEGFGFYSGGGGDTAFAGGMMTVDSNSYEEWILYSDTPSKWWNSVHPSKGWWVEARLRVDLADPGCADGPGIWIHDRGKLFQLHFGDGVLMAQPGGSVPFDTSAFHVYRFEDYGDGTRRVLADGVEVLDLSAEAGGDGTLALTLGDLGGCGHSIVVWDHYAYDTFAPGGEDGDIDEDGVTNADDNCFEVSNADQANVDGDGLGDVCDPCPVDALDDSDGDGVCDSDDACPDDPSTSEEPCPSGSSGFMGDGFGDVTGDDFGSGTTDGTGGSGSASGGGSAGGTAGSASASAGSVSAGSASATADETGGSGSAGSGDGDGGGCSCSSEGTPRSAWWAAVVLAAAVRRRRSMIPVTRRTYGSP
jgi:MYXO-CTERM domain-containing protein